MVKHLFLVIRSIEVIDQMALVVALPFMLRTLSVIRRSDLEKDFSGECMWLEILLPKAKGILFGTFYRPPTQSDFLAPFQEILDFWILHALYQQGI